MCLKIMTFSFNLRISWRSFQSPFSKLQSKTTASCHVDRVSVITKVCPHIFSLFMSIFFLRRFLLLFFFFIKDYFLIRYQLVLVLQNFTKGLRILSLSVLIEIALKRLTISNVDAAFSRLSNSLSHTAPMRSWASSIKRDESDSQSSPKISK